jgi:L-aspartate oxidase
MVAAASARTESRGCHRRTDHPEPRPEWVTHLAIGLPEPGDATSNQLGPVTVVGGPSVAGDLDPLAASTN